MTEELPPDRALECPKSGQLLGLLVSCLRLDDPAVGGRTAAPHLDRNRRPAKEYFAGAWLGDERRYEVCNWIAAALLQSGLLGDLLLPNEHGARSVAPDGILGPTIYGWLQRWDCAFHRTAVRWPRADRVLGGFVMSRQVVIDAALRAVAARYLAADAIPINPDPPWCHRAGAARITRRILEQHFPARSLEYCAGAFEVDRRTIERWRDEREALVPSEDSLCRIAAAIADAGGMSLPAALVCLRRQYGMFSLLREIARGIGWKWALELAKQFLQFQAWTIADFGTESVTAEFLRNQGLSLMNGVAFPLNAVVLDEWLKRDLGPLWHDDVIAARDGAVESRLNGCFRVIGNWHDGRPLCLPGMDDLTPSQMRDFCERAFLWAMNDNSLDPSQAAELTAAGHTVVRIPARDDAVRVANRVQQAMTAVQRGDYEGSLAHWARVVALEPTNAKYRFFYGAALWQAIPSKDFERAVQELEEACRLDPQWDRPFVEIAIVWLNRGLPDQALHHLQSDASGFRSRSDHFNWIEGVALRLLRRHEEALAAFERAIELNPDHAESWDFAADCAFHVNDRIKGRRYAKRAFDLGRRTSHQKWDV